MPRIRHRKELQLTLAVAVSAGCFATIEAPDNGVGAGSNPCLYTPGCTEPEHNADAGTGNVPDMQACAGPDTCAPLNDPEGWNYSPDMVRPGVPGELTVRFDIANEIPHSEEALRQIRDGWSTEEYYAMVWLELLDFREGAVTEREQMIDPVLGKYRGGYIDTVHVWSETAQRPGPFVQYRICSKCPTYPDPDDIDVKTTPTPRILDTPVTHEAVWDGRRWDDEIAPDGTYALWIEATSSENEFGAFAAVLFDKGPTPSGNYESLSVMPSQPGAPVLSDGSLPFPIQTITVEWRPSSAAANNPQVGSP